MSAPALILLAPSTHESRGQQIYHRLRQQMQVERPSLSIHLAFTQPGSPSLANVAHGLVNREVREAVIVPLDVTRAVESSADIRAGIHALNHSTRITFELSRPIGPALELLNILDVRLRNALSTIHATELDGLVLSVPSWGDTRGSALLGRRARQWSTAHRLPVQLAHHDGPGMSVASAIDALHDMGRRSVAVGSFFLVADETYLHQAEQALSAGAIAVSGPLGADQRICDLIMARYAFSAMDLLTDEEVELSCAL